MIEQICIRTSETILSVLVTQTEIKDGCIYDPQAYYGCIHRLTSGVLGIVASHNLHFTGTATPENVNDSFRNLTNTLGENCLFVKNFKLLSDEERVALNVFYDWFVLQKPAQLCLSDIYELSLSLEFPIKEGAIVKGYDNHIRNTIGSFYTPKPLADKCVELTLNTYIFQNTGIEHFSRIEKTEDQAESVLDLLSDSTFADHACGTGSFPLAIFRYIRKHLPNNTDALLTKVGLNFTAIEADSLALEVAKLEILNAINASELYSEISKNFIHGNPLLKPNGATASSSFNDNFYYHNRLAIDVELLPVCDIIMGNPPWGTVCFDYDYFFHTIHPHLQEIENEEDLTQAVYDLEISHPKLYDWFIEHENANDLSSEQIYEDVRFVNSNMGDLHTNVLFTELTDSLCSKRGAVGLILKGSTLSDKSNQKLVRHLANRQRITERYDFINAENIFNIEKDERFSILVLGANEKNKYKHKKNLTDLNQIQDRL